MHRILILVLTTTLLFSCNEVSESKTSTSKNVWMSDLEKMNLKGDVHSIREQKYFNNIAVPSMEYYIFDSNGMIERKEILQRNGETDLYDYEYDNQNRITEYILNNQSIRINYNKDSNILTYYYLNKPFQIFTYNNSGNITLSRQNLGGGIFDSCVFTYKANLLIKQTTYIKQKMQLQQVFIRDTIGHIIEEIWKQGDSPATKSTNSYLFDKYQNWVQKTVLNESDTIYVVKRKIEYKN